MPAQTTAEIERKAAAFDAAMAAEGRAIGRKSMLKLHRMTEADLAPKTTAAQRQAEALAALPTSIAAAKGDARAYAKADIMRQAAAERGITASTPGRASMVAELKRQGMGPAR